MPGGTLRAKWTGGRNHVATKPAVRQAMERLKGMSSADVNFEIEQATVRRETARMAAASLR